MVFIRLFDGCSAYFAGPFDSPLAAKTAIRRAWPKLFLSGVESYRLFSPGDLPRYRDELLEYLTACARGEIFEELVAVARQIARRKEPVGLYPGKKKLRPCATDRGLRCQRGVERASEISGASVEEANEDHF